VLGGSLAFGASIGAFMWLRPYLADVATAGPHPRPSEEAPPPTPTPPPPSTPPVASAATLVSASVPSPPPPPATAPPASSVQNAAPPPSAHPAGVDARTCELDTSAARPGHRVFLDGRVVGETPRLLRVPCGGHELRMGSAGAAQHVVLPCGGTFKARSK
jgi:hypothetical protein